MGATIEHLASHASLLAAASAHRTDPRVRARWEAWVQAQVQRAAEGIAAERDRAAVVGAALTPTEVAVTMTCLGERLILGAVEDFPPALPVARIRDVMVEVALPLVYGTD